MEDDDEIKLEGTLFVARQLLIRAAPLSEGRELARVVRDAAESIKPHTACDDEDKPQSSLYVARLLLHRASKKLSHDGRDDIGKELWAIAQRLRLLSRRSRQPIEFNDPNASIEEKRKARRS